MIDSSSSITDHWEALKQFLISVTDAFTIGADGVQVAIVTYSTEPRRVFGFDPLKTKEVLKFDIRHLDQIGGGELRSMPLQSTTYGHATYFRAS